MSKKTPKHLFSSDRPINYQSEDLLGRVGFADSLALAIKGWTGNDSLVIALYGPWGSGKSSIKNMVLELLRKAKKECPFIVEFTPWQWSGQEQLAEAFFREIGTVLEKADKTKGKKTGCQVAPIWLIFNNGSFDYKIIESCSSSFRSSRVWYFRCY